MATKLKPTSPYTFEVWTADGMLLLGTIQNHVGFWSVMDEQPSRQYASKRAAVASVVNHAAEMGWF